MTEVTISEQRWAPVSAGEYDRRTRTIAVNLTVVDEVVARFGHTRDVVVAAIVAHERVHVLAPPGSYPHEDERRAREAAVAAAGHEVVAHVDDVLARAWT